MVDDLIQGDLPPPEKLDNRVMQEAINLVAAGSITTAVILTAAFYHLVADSKLLNRLQEELLDAFKDISPNALPSLTQLEQLPFLTAVLKETLRLHYGIMERLPVIHQDEDLLYSHYKIPRGTPVSMSSFLMHNDPIFGRNSDVFDPDRWLSSDTSKMDRFLTVFGRGSRACLGVNLAWAEMYTFIAAVFWPAEKLRYRLYETDMSDVDVQRDLFVALPKLDSKGVRVMVETSS